MATPAAADHAVRIDPASYQLAAVAVGTDPSAVTGGGLVWVASRKDGTVTVVDPATNQVQETLPASGSGPVGRGGPGLAFSSGNLWVANTQQRRVDRAPLDTDATPIAVGASPVALAASPDAVWVAARTRGGGLLARIDAVTNQVVPTLRLPHASTGLAVTGDGADGLGRHRRRPGRPPRRHPRPPGGRADRAAESPRPGGIRRRRRLGDQRRRRRGHAGRRGRQRGPDHPGGQRPHRDRVRRGPAVGGQRPGRHGLQDQPETNQVGTIHLGFRPAAVAVEQDAVWVALAA